MIRRSYSLALISLLACAPCPAQRDPSIVANEALKARQTGKGDRRFRLRPPTETGVTLKHEFPKNAPFALMTDQYSGCGVCLGDVDGDGLPDIFVTNYDQGNKLYRNLGGWRFEDVTAKAGVDGQGRWCAGPTFADVDNDGDLDLHVSVFNAPNLLYLNDGKGVFQESAKAAGLDYQGASVMMSFADYDRDGDLDGYLVTHRMPLGDRPIPPRGTKEALDRGILKVEEVKGRKAARVTEEYRDLFDLMPKGEGRIELITAGQADLLYRNEGNGRFVHVSESAGVKGRRIGLAATWWDADDDGWPDLYVSNDYKGADQLYRNNRDGTFTDVTREWLPHVCWLSMGSDVADINNDGLLDFLATDMAGTDHYKAKVGMGDMSNDAWFLKIADPPQYMRNAVFLNSGAQRFWEVAHLTGLAKSDWTWSAKFGDFDNDGWTDLYVTNGMSRDFMNSDLAKQFTGWRSEEWANTPILKQANLAFRNRGDLRFENVGPAWGLDQMTASYGAATADIDRDGDLDIVAMNFGESMSVLENVGGAGHSMLLRLQGQASNRWGVGAKVTVQSKAGHQAQYLTLARGFMSANEPLAHIGLGSESKAAKVIIDWPSGRSQELRDIPAGRFLTIAEPSGQEAKAESKRLQPWFTRLPEDGWRHQERPFDDYERQPLLPMKHSQMGPGLAVGDVNGDGAEDGFFGGAAGQPGRLRIQGAKPRDVTEPFGADTASEDLGALIFEADGDGDLDLLVASGGVECQPGDALLRPRLYLNDGQGNFQKAADRLPDLRDSCAAIAAADFDRDGDLDVFLGGRVVPGKYPETPNSHLLINDGGKFRPSRPPLGGLGMVTSALWSDADNDGWVDLFVALDWGPIRYLRNERGKLADATAKAGLAEFTGWWNSLAGADLDRDGDIDLVAGNLGQNTKYHATKEHPYRLYYGDFDGKGTKQLVEATFEHGVPYPERGRSCSSAAMPFLKDKFPTFQAFAAATLDQVYGQDKLASAIRLEANTFDTGVFLNDGQGRFSFRPLPRLAQVSPTFGVAVFDANEDAALDIVLAQNNFSPQPETGRFDGGMGLALTGDGKGEFRVVGPRESGFVVPGDAKALVETVQNGQRKLLIGVNNAPAQSFASNGKTRFITLRGKPGNPQAIGARVTFLPKHGVAEVRAGGGYLSQSTASLAVPSGCESLRVRWPDGATSEHEITESSEIVQPSR